MPRYGYERLSAESASHLKAESARSFNHALTVLIFERGPLAGQGSGVDFAEIARGIESQLHRAPRFRQRLKWIPYEDHPVWVDDGEFNLDYHLRHTCLPAPGSRAELRKLVGRLMSNRLDRSRPMWECWVVEGFEDGGFALISKVHNCLVESDSGGDLLQALLSSDAERNLGKPVPFDPRPVPSGLELMRDEFVHGAKQPLRALERLRQLPRDPDTLTREAERRVEAIARLLGYSATPPRATPLNGRLGPHRRFQELVIPLETLRRIHRAFECTVHDALLGILCGGLRNFLRENLVHPASLDFRVATPVQTQAGADRDEVSHWYINLPVWERDPARLIAAIREQTRRAYETTPALAAQTVFGVPRWTGSRLLTLGARSLGAFEPVNMSVTSVPGSPKPLFFMGAELQESFGLTPLCGVQGVGIGAISYDGKLCIGINADFDLVPNIERLAELFDESARELLRAAREHGRNLSAVEIEEGGEGATS